MTAHVLTICRTFLKSGIVRGLLRAIKHRDKIEDPAIADYVLQSLETIWLLSDQYEEAISFFSEYTQHNSYNMTMAAGAWIQRSFFAKPSYIF